MSLCPSRPTPAGATRTSLETRILFGALLWAAFSVVAVLLEGPQWDENYEWGQIITRMAPYPDGHPLFVFTRNAFTIQTYASAALLKLGCGPGFVCGHRNVVFLLATVLPVFLLASVLSRRVLCGHLAALFILLGIHLEMSGSYPQFTWPSYFSNGHIGTGYALLVLGLLAGGYRPPALFLLGMMPCVHVAQMPPLLLLLGVQAAWAFRARDRVRDPDVRRQWLRAIPFGAAGAGLCGVLWLIHRHFIVPPAASGVYAPGGDARSVWQGITLYYDIHRAIPKSGVSAAGIGVILLSLAAVRLHAPRALRPGPWTWLAVYAIGLCASVWTVAALHHAWGAENLFVLLRSMPYRLLNHMPPLLLAATVSLLAPTPRYEDGPGPLSGLLPLLLLYAVAFLLLAPLMGGGIVRRYGIPSAGMPYFLLGAAAAVLVARFRREGRAYAPWLALFAGALAALGLIHHYGMACGLVALAMAPAWMTLRPRVPSSFSRFSGPAALAGTCLVAAAVLLAQLWALRNPLPGNDFEKHAAAYLADFQTPDSLVVPYPGRLFFLAKTRHAVMTDNTIPTWVSYMPAIARPVANIYRDIYGIEFAYSRDRNSPPDLRAWRHIYARRTPEEWARLGNHYGFRFVLAPSNVAVSLPVAVQGRDETLYEVAVLSTQ